jgi:hypothetical protein
VARINGSERLDARIAAKRKQITNMCLYVRFAFRKRIKPAKRSDGGGAILTAPDQIWVADIAYIRLAEEFV